MRQRTLSLAPSSLAAALTACLGVFAAAGCSSPGRPELAATAASLTADQCQWAADTDRKVTICHRTGSETNPYVIINIATAACSNAHADHEGDYVASTDPADATYDPTCNGQGCLPEGAPADRSIECCEGLQVNAEGKCAKMLLMCDYTRSEERIALYKKVREKAASVFAAYAKGDCAAVGSVDSARNLLSQLQTYAADALRSVERDFEACQKEALEKGLVADTTGYEERLAYLRNELRKLESALAWLSTCRGTK